MSGYLRPGDGTVWPDPIDPLAVEWQLRYGNPSKSERLVAASYIAAYRHLVSMARREREARIRGLRAATSSEDGEGQ